MVYIDIIEQLLSNTTEDTYWNNFLNSLLKKTSCHNAIHLAILVEPYLQFILDGKKTVESRFSKNRIAPYCHIERNDIILLKKTGGPIVGVCQASDVWFYRLDPSSWEEIRNDFSEMLCAQDQNFWSQRQGASYATLIRLKNVKKISPFNFSKRDRRGWVVLNKRQRQLNLL